MSTVNEILDISNYRWQAAAVPASPGSKSIQNILGTLKSVDDQGVATDLGGGAAVPGAGMVKSTGAALAVATPGTDYSLYPDYSATVVGASVQDLDLTGLAGVVGPIEFEIFVDSDAAGAITLQPENLATNQVGGALFEFNAGAASSANQTTLQLFAGNVNQFKTAVCRLDAAINAGPRQFICTYYDISAKLFLTSAGFWTDITTPLTKVRVHHAGGAHIKAGSYIKARDLKKA